MVTPQKARPARAWLRILVLGLGLFVLGMVLVGLTGNLTLFPTVVLLGSFVVPATYVMFFYERRRISTLTLSATVLCFFWGGVLGVFAASILEPIFVGGLTIGTAFVIGLIEEFVKLLGVLLIARRRSHTSELNGLILGAAAGMGFAALESMGYVFSAFLRSGGSLSATVLVTLLRAVLSPVGHGTWTAILVAVLFRASLPHRFRVTRSVVAAYLTVSILHGLWDGVPLVMGTFLLPGLDVLIGQSIVGLTGLFLLWRRWREALRLQEVEAQPQAVQSEAEMSIAQPEAFAGTVQVPAGPDEARTPAQAHENEAAAPESHD